MWFACNFEYSSFCGWTCETGTGAEWLIQTKGAPAVHKGPTHDHSGRRHMFTLVIEDVFSQHHLGEALAKHSAPFHVTIQLFKSQWKPLFARCWNFFNKALNNSLCFQCCWEFTAVTLFYAKNRGKKMPICKRKFPLGT